MMILKKHLTFFTFLFCSVSVFGQSWVDMMHDPSYTVEEVRKAYEQQWGHKPYERGQGHKQFERWAHFMEQRLGPDGKRPSADIAWKEMKKYNEVRAHMRSTGFQGNWKSMGPSEWVNHNSGYNPGLGRVNWVELDPINPQTIYLSTPSGGFWKSPNGGNTWQNLTDHLPVIGATGFAINPQNNQTILLGTGDGYGSSAYGIGLLKSHDGGLTWDTTGLSFALTQFVRISAVSYVPGDTNKIMVAASNGVYRSEDGGDTWSQVISGGNFRAMAFHPLNPDVLFVASDEFFKSEDGGVTFQHITAGLPNGTQTSRMALGVSPADSSRLYVLAASAQTQGLLGFYRSDDVGESFVLKLDTPNILASDVNGANTGGQGWYDLCIAVSPLNADHVFTGGVNIWSTFNGGDSFTLMSHWRYDNTNNPYVHADIHYLGYHGNMLYVGCDGGIFRTGTGGLSWQDLSEGLEITQVYGIGLSPTYNNIMQFGSQDNGTYRLENGVWKHIFGADGMHTIIHPANPDIVYISTQYGNLRKSVDGGTTFNRIMNNINETGLWVTPYIMHPTDPNTLYVGKDNLWRSTDAGATWQMIAQTGSAKVRHIAQSKTNPDIIYYSTGTRPLVTIDGGQNWSFTGPGLPSSFMITDMEVAPDDPDVIYVTLSGYGNNNKVYKSSDRGQTWVNISDGLPNLPANCIVAQIGDKERLYIGMDVGVYYREEGMAEWEPFFDGMPNVIVNDLEIQYNIGTIRAGTYGRGIWESQLAFVHINNEKYRPENITNVYPNPASNAVFIESPVNANVSLHTMDGKALRNFEVKGDQLFQLDVTSFSPGIYLMRFDGESGSYVKKCVIQ
jgi:photosystem II stability/assembly factor-like uncharacterized protein